MAQNLWPIIDGNTSGLELVAILNARGQAIDTGQLGPTVPADAPEGFVCVLKDEEGKYSLHIATGAGGSGVEIGAHVLQGILDAVTARNALGLKDLALKDEIELEDVAASAMATDAEVIAGTQLAKLVTHGQVRWLIANLAPKPLGYGSPGLQDVTGARAANVTYQNVWDRPRGVMLVVEGRTEAQGVQVLSMNPVPYSLGMIGRSFWDRSSQEGFGASNRFLTIYPMGPYIIPAGWFYRFISPAPATFNIWYEY